MTSSNIQKRCFTYPFDKETILLKTIVILILGLVSFAIVYQEFNNNLNILTFSFGILGLGALVDVYTRFHRLLNYDQICIDGDYLIVNYKKVQVSKTLLKDIHLVSKTSPFDMFQVSYQRLYCDETLLFHYRTNELNCDDEKKLIELIGA